MNEQRTICEATHKNPNTHKSVSRPLVIDLFAVSANGRKDFSLKNGWNIGVSQ